MKTISTPLMGKILKWVLVCVFGFGLIFTPICHWGLHTLVYDDLNMKYIPFVDNLIGTGPIYETEYKFIVFELYTLGVVMLGIVIQLIQICEAIEKSEPFTMKTAKALKRIAVLSLILIAVYVVKLVIYPRLPCILIFCTFIVVGLVSSVFSQLFKIAVEYKEENDFTI